MSILFDLYAYLIPICIALGVLEFLSEIFWWRVYFTFGIPVFSRTIPVSSAVMRVPAADDIEEYGLPDDPSDTSILVKEVATDCFGLRFHKGGFRRYCSVLHGCVLFDKVNSRIIIKGFADWTASAFGLAALTWLLMVTIEAPGLTFVAPAVIILIVLWNTYSKERNRLNELAGLLERFWS